MKKKYIAPKIEVIKMENIEMVATSGGVNSGGTGVETDDFFQGGDAAEATSLDYDVWE